MINKRYSIFKKIGQGRSSVYLCSDTENPNVTFAIKILQPNVDEEEKQNFIREYYLLQNLDHPNIIKSYDIGTIFKADENDFQPGSLFIVFEYFDSDELLKSGLIRTEENLVEISVQICSALYYLHQSRYIYYDLKPENILVALQNNNPVVKLIDLGLAEYSPHPQNYSIKGTAQYIAPELLKKESHNHSVDLYSLGMMLYRLIYNQFPFSTVDELGIYKEQIENEFNFLSAEGFSDSFIEIIKKLLSKDPGSRYKSSLEVITDLRIHEQMNVFSDFVPAKVLAGRNKELEILTGYISDKSGSEIVSIRGIEGAGKTTILRKLNELNRNSVLINNRKGKSGPELIKQVFSKLIFSEALFPNLNVETISKAVELLDLPDDEFLLSIKSILISFSSQCEYILLIDDFNIFDDFSSELFHEIIPLLQINNIKVIVGENSDLAFSTSSLHNVKKLSLNPFTAEELHEFIEKSFIETFPRKQLEELISEHSDLIPGSIISFIKDLIQFDILLFKAGGVVITDDEEKLSLLKKSHSAIYDLRLSKLNKTELGVISTISAFDLSIDTKTLAVINELSVQEINKLVENIQQNNILQQFTSGQTLNFTSDGLKKHVYSKIVNKEKLHLNIAEKIAGSLASFSRNELARHYELAGKYEQCYSILEKEVAEAEKHSALTYMKNILEHLVSLPLSVGSTNQIKIKLSEVYFKLSDFNSALRTIESLQENELVNEKLNAVKTIKAGSLIGAGEFALGKEVLNDLLQRIKDDDEKNRLMVEIAYADFEQKNYDEAEKRCNALLNNSDLSTELKGRCYNLKGMRCIYQDNDLHSALGEFKSALNNFKESKSPRRIAGMEVNIGNIHTILRDYINAEKHWQNALEINRSVGNLEQEGLILLNLGISYFFRGRFDEAIESYEKSGRIFLNLGIEINRGLVLLNQGEAYTAICDYDKALNCLEEGLNLFQQIENFEELAETLLMLGKLYFVIGFRDRLQETVKTFEENLEKNSLPEKHKLNLEFLRILLSIADENKVDLSALEDIKNEYKELDDKSGYVDSCFLLIKNLISQLKFEEALNEINNEFLIDLCSQNSILEAEREYFLGIISQKHASDKILPPLEHYEKAYNLVKDENLSEITWKILLLIAETYIERGNLTKAKTYTIYGRELIHFIAEKMESPRLRAAYLKQPERLNAMKKFENFYPA